MDMSWKLLMDNRYELKLLMDNGYALETTHGQWI